MGPPLNYTIPLSFHTKHNHPLCMSLILARLARIGKCDVVEGKLIPPFLFFLILFFFLSFIILSSFLSFLAPFLSFHTKHNHLPYMSPILARLARNGKCGAAEAPFFSFLFFFFLSFLLLSFIPPFLSFSYQTQSSSVHVLHSCETRAHWETWCG